MDALRERVMKCAERAKTNPVRHGIYHTSVTYLKATMMVPSIAKYVSTVTLVII